MPLTARPHRSRPFALALVAIVSALLLSGCIQQRESRGQYEMKVKEKHQLLYQTFAQIERQDLGDAEYWQEAHKQMEAAATDMSELSPPRDVQQAHEAYVSSLFGVSRVLGKFAECASLHETDPAKAIECRREITLRDLDDIQNDLTEAEAIYRHHSYDIPELVREQE